MKKILAVFALAMLCAFSVFAKQVTGEGFGSTDRLRYSSYYGTENKYFVIR